MEFTATPEQRELRSIVGRLVRERAPISSARALAESGARHDPAAWAAFAETGLPALGIPEELGGAGASLLELAIVAEEFGRALVGAPFLSTMLASYALLGVGDDEAAAQHLAAIASGELTATLAVLEDDGTWREDAVTTDASERVGGAVLSGRKRLVLDGAHADLLLVAARGETGVSLYAVPRDAAGLNVTPLVALDLTRSVADVSFDQTPAGLLGKPGAGWAAISHALWAGSVLLAAEQAGGAAQTVEVTAEYARTRRQFGRQIGAFQGVKHRLADMAVRSEMAHSTAFWAAAQEPGTAAAAMGAAVAASYCAESYLQNAKDMIQLHGGIGFTWEHDAHLFLRRARSTFALLGSPSQHRAGLLDYLDEEATL